MASVTDNRTLVYRTEGMRNLPRLPVTQPADPGSATVALLERVVRTEVVPELARRHAQPWLAAELADLAREGRTDEATAVVREEADRAPTSAARAGDLVLAAARTLGDLWLEDECSEFEATLGVGCLQVAMRRAEQGREAPRPHPRTQVLVAVSPGEPHCLASVVSDQLLRRAGWDVRCAFPADDAELEALLSTEWFDNLDLSLSPAFRREDRMPKLGRTIAAARAASCNPDVAVTVSGRIFAEAAWVAQVGADGPTSALRAGRA